VSKALRERSAVSDPVCIRARTGRFAGLPIAFARPVPSRRSAASAHGPEPSFSWLQIGLVSRWGGPSPALSAAIATACGMAPATPSARLHVRRSTSLGRLGGPRPPRFRDGHARPAGAFATASEAPGTAASAACRPRHRPGLSRPGGPGPASSSSLVSEPAWRLASPRSRRRSRHRKGHADQPSRPGEDRLGQYQLNGR
jgi:hypothetical protein